MKQRTLEKIDKHRDDVMPFEEGECKNATALLVREPEELEPAQESAFSLEIWQNYSDCRMQHFAQGR